MALSLRGIGLVGLRCHSHYPVRGLLLVLGLMWINSDVNYYSCLYSLGLLLQVKVESNSTQRGESQCPEKQVIDTSVISVVQSLSMRSHALAVTRCNILKSVVVSS